MDILEDIVLKLLWGGTVSPSPDKGDHDTQTFIKAIQNWPFFSKKIFVKTLSFFKTCKIPNGYFMTSESHLVTLCLFFQLLLAFTSLLLFNIGPPARIINSKKIGGKKINREKRGTVFYFDANPISQKRGLASASSNRKGIRGRKKGRLATAARCESRRVNWNQSREKKLEKKSGAFKGFYWSREKGFDWW